MNHASTLHISWQARLAVCYDPQHNTSTHLSLEEAETWALPALPDAQAKVQRLYLPMEQLLTRAVQFPFHSPSLVDADMLFQHLCEEVIDAEPEQWWLAWHLEACEDGVVGMVFGLPESLRQQIQHEPAWSHAPDILVDGYERLQPHRISGEAAAIVDTDDDGLFYGFFDGQAWRGMRRMSAKLYPSDAMHEVLRALQSMGFDASTQPIKGVLSEAWQAALPDQVNFQGEVHAHLGDRHQRNLALGSTSPLNFRHGRWSALQAWQQLSFWKRSLILCAITLLTWFGGGFYQLHQLDKALQAQQQRIEDAFHRGLPDAPVMLDALAQLRQAAGSTETGQQRDFLADLAAVGQVYKQYPWTMDSLSLRDGQVHMSGNVSDITTLNHIQTSLQDKLQREVKIVDTQMGQKQVSFRMTW